MPLIDEEFHATDQRSRRASPWPWIVVIAALAVVWVLLSIGISVLARARPSGSSQATAAAVQQLHTTRVDQAEQMTRYGDWIGAARVFQALDPSLPLDTSRKHTYLRLTAQSLVKSGSNAAAVPFYERYIGWAVDLNQAECRGCHGPGPGIFPQSPAQMEFSATARAYAAAHTATGQLTPRRDALRKQHQKNPHDARLRLLLHPLENALGNEKAAREHLAALKRLK
jgi:hypothetical protein